MSGNKEYIGIGRRKTSIASVRLRLGGSGRIKVNGGDLEKIFTLPLQKESMLAPLVIAQIPLDSCDLVVRCSGGGIEGQAGAVRLGLARALVEQNPDLRGDLKSQGFLRRDPRKKERKKYGKAGARKSFQFTKR